jgi:hypothetical protein
MKMGIGSKVGVGRLGSWVGMRMIVGEGVMEGVIEGVSVLKGVTVTVSVAVRSG